MTIYNREDSRTVLPQIEKQIENMVDLLYPVGSYYYTSDTKFDPTKTWRGEWSSTTNGGVVTWHRTK